jgi:hypothetical protein
LDELQKLGQQLAQKVPQSPTACPGAALGAAPEWAHQKVQMAHQFMLLNFI